jgi:hypothetical protein
MVGDALEGPGLLAPEAVFGPAARKPFLDRRELPVRGVLAGLVPVGYRGILVALVPSR